MTRFVSLVCPDGHGPLRDMDGGSLYCSAADHDGRPKSHKLGAAPASRSWWTYEDLLALQNPAPASAPHLDKAVLPGVGRGASKRRLELDRAPVAATTADPDAGGSGSAPLLSSARASSSSSRRRAGADSLWDFE